MNTVKSIFGMKTKAQKQAQRAQAEATAAQKRAANAAAEDTAAARAEASASGRRLRGAGRRALAFQGIETGVLAPTLAG